MSSIFKTPPFAHQRKAYDISKDAECFAYLMEQGTGKSKVGIDVTAYRYGKGHIEALFIVAPNGVHINWILNEIPAHLHDSIERRCAFWSSRRTKQREAELKALYEPGTFLRVLAMNIDAFNTPRGWKEAKKFLKTFKTLWLLDESSRIKNHTAKRTGRIIDMSDLAPIRRILTGTPVTQAPMDVFTQFRFLDPFILQTQTFQAFKAEYCQLLPDGHGLLRHIKERIERSRQSSKSQRKVYTPQIVEKDKDGRPIYRNLDKLQALIAPHSFRVRKEDCLDLPPKLYTKTYCELGDEQREAYDSLANDLRLRLRSGELTTVTKLTLITRLHQVICGYGPNETGLKFDRPFYPNPMDNPRIQACVNSVAETSGGVIIWSRFREAIDDICTVLNEVFPGDGVVQYHGGVKQGERPEAVRTFQAGNARFFVGNAQSGGIGLTLTAGKYMSYYANSFSLEERLQSEDRFHRIGQTGDHVTINDVEAIDTMDTHIIATLRNKRDVAAMVTGDPKCAWI